MKELLLWELANNPGPFPNRYPKLFASDADPQETTGVLSQLLRQAWDAKNFREREWWCHGLDAYYHRDRVDRDLKESLGPVMAKGLLGDALEPGSWLYALQRMPQRSSVLEDAMLYFRKNAGDARRCLSPECSTPYYFAHKKNQKFCSLACAKPAQRAAKRKWWHENRGK